MRNRLLLLAACSWMTLACQHEEPLDGSYRGTLQSSVGQATVTLSVQEVQKVIAGTARGQGLGFTGELYTVAGSHQETGAIEIDISMDNQLGGGDLPPVVVGACAYRLTGSGDSTHIAGSYGTHGCATGSTGTFQLDRP